MRNIKYRTFRLSNGFRIDFDKGDDIVADAFYYYGQGICNRIDENTKFFPESLDKEIKDVMKEAKK